MTLGPGSLIEQGDGYGVRCAASVLDHVAVMSAFLARHQDADAFDPGQGVAGAVDLLAAELDADSGRRRDHVGADDGVCAMVHPDGPLTTLDGVALDDQATVEVCVLHDLGDVHRDPAVPEDAVRQDGVRAVVELHPEAVSVEDATGDHGVGREVVHLDTFRSYVVESTVVDVHIVHVVDRDRSSEQPTEDTAADPQAAGPGEPWRIISAGDVTVLEEQAAVHRVPVQSLPVDDGVVDIDVAVELDVAEAQVAALPALQEADPGEDPHAGFERLDLRVGDPLGGDQGAVDLLHFELDDAVGLEVSAEDPVLVAYSEQLRPVDLQRLAGDRRGRGDGDLSDLRQRPHAEHGAGRTAEVDVVDTLDPQAAIELIHAGTEVQRPASGV